MLCLTPHLINDLTADVMTTLYDIVRYSNVPNTRVLVCVQDEQSSNKFSVGAALIRCKGTSSIDTDVLLPSQSARAEVIF